MSNWTLHHGDCIPHMAEVMEPQSVDFSVFSPAFPALYAYSSDPADMGNTDTMGPEAKIHLSFFYKALARVLKPGRVACVHVMQIPRMKRNGVDEVGLHDFRGTNIRIGARAGLIYEYDWLIRKNPQAQAIQTRARELQFAGLESDRAKQRGTLGDYIIKFRAPGENAVPICDYEKIGINEEVDDKIAEWEQTGKRLLHGSVQVSRNDWIKWAEASWADIRQTFTLNWKIDKGDDTRHICVARGSLVLTRNGHIPIEDVSVGDMVLTHLGRWRKVTGKRCNGMKPIVQIKAQGVPFLKLTPDHRIWTRVAVGVNGGVSHPRKFAKNSLPQWIEAKDTLASYVNQKLPPVESSDYSIKEWWLIGRWLGDGHVDTRGSLHISCAYSETAELCQTLGDNSGFIANTGTSNQVRIKDPSGRLRRLLKRCGRKADGKRLPVEALSLEPIKASALLSGYLSADGHWNAQNSRWMGSSVSRALLLGMSMIAQRVHGVCSAVYAGRKGGIGEIQGRAVNLKDDWIISIPPRNLSGFVADDGTWKKVRSVNPCEQEEVWDLRVEEDESFTVEGCIVHNCPLQLDVVERLIRLYSNPGELVFSPFTGIGTEGYMALQLGRKFYGCELKPEYVAASKKNFAKIDRELKAGKQDTLDFGEESEVDNEASV